MPMGDSFWGGYNDTQSQLIAQQGAKTQQALEIARMIMTERQAEHQKHMDEWMKDPSNPQNVHAAAQAKYWESQAETAKARQEADEEQRKEQRFNEAYQRGYLPTLTAGGSVAQAEALLRAVDPERARVVHDVGFHGYKVRKQMEQQDKGMEPIAPGEAQVPMPEPAQPMPAGRAAPMPMLQPVIGGFAGAAMPPAPTVPAGPPPTAFGGAPVQPTVSATSLQPQPTEEDFLASQSPAYLAAREKERQAAATARMREQARMVSAQAQTERAGAMQATADARGKDAETRRMALDQHLGPYANSANLIERRIGVQEKLEQSLSEFRKTMGAAATKNAVTKAQNSDRAYKIWKGLSVEASKAEDQSRKLAGLATIAEDAYEKARAESDNTLAASEADPDNPAKSDAAFQSALKMHNMKKQRDAIKAESDKLKDVAAGYRATSDRMRNDMSGAGLVDFTDGKGGGPQSRLPGNPRSRVDSFTKSLGIP